MGSGGGQVVSVLAFYSNDPISNPAKAYSFLVKFVFEKNKNKQKRPGLPIFKKNKHSMRASFLIPLAAPQTNQC